MPAKMAMEKPFARIGGEPGRQIGAGRVCLAALVTNMREPVRTMRVVRVYGHGALDFRARRRELPILRKRHGMMGKEPEIVAVMRGEAVHQRGDLVLLPDAAGGADQAIRVRGGGEHQGVARRRCQMRVQGVDRRLGLAREREVEIPDMTCLALRQTGGQILGRRQGRPRCRHVAFPHQYLRLPGMGQGETGVRCDGAVKGLDRAWVKGQRQIAALDVGAARRLGGSAQSEVVSVCQHIEYSRALLKI